MKIKDLDKKDYFKAACMYHYQENYQENCEEMKAIHHLRICFIDLKEREHYEKVAPKIIEQIDKLPNRKAVYTYLYDEVITRITDYHNNGFKIAAFCELYRATTDAFELLLLPNEKTHTYHLKKSQ